MSTCGTNQVSIFTRVRVRDTIIASRDATFSQAVIPVNSLAMLNECKPSVLCVECLMCTTACTTAV